MARTVRNPLELRTPVRTISSVMRNAPRQQFRPTQLDFGDGRQDRGDRVGRGGMGVRGGQDDFGNLTSVTRAPRETIAGGSPVSGGVTTPTSRGTTTGAPVARVQTGASRAPQGLAKSAVTSTLKAPTSQAGAKPPVAKPVTAKATTLKPTIAKTPVTAKTAAKAPVTAKTAAKAPVAAKTPVTSKLTTPAKTPVSAKTTVSTKPPVQAKTTTPVAKTPVTKTPAVSTVKPTTTTTKPTSSLTSTLKNAAIGAGTAALVNKLIGKTPTSPVQKTPTSPVKPTGIPSSTKTTGTTKPTGIPTSTTKPTGIPTSVVKPPVTKPTSTATKAATAAAATKAATSTKATGATGATGALTEEQIQAELDRVNAEKEANTVPEGAVTNEDGSYSVTEDGMTTTYAADGSIIGMEAADTTTGTDTTLTTGADTSTMTDLGEGYFADADGNVYGADGNLMYTVGADGEYVEAGTSGVDTSTSTADETTWTDPDTGLTWNLGADGEWSQEGGSTEDVTSWTDPETGLTWNQGADGEWSQEGFDASAEDTTSWTDPETGLTWNQGADGQWEQEGFDDTLGVDDTLLDDGSGDDAYVADDEFVDDGTDYEEAKGGSIVKKYKRNARRFLDGGLNSLGYGEDEGYSDTGEEVQPFQNVDYNYGEFDDPTMFAGDTSPYAGSMARNTYLSSSPAALSSIADDASSEWNDNGDGTFSHWEGDEYVTVDGETNTELSRTDADGNIVDPANIPSTSSTGGWNDNGDGTYSRWDGDQYVTVDGETNTELLRTDSEGNPVTAPVGSITSSGAGNKPSFATAAADAAVNQNQPDQTGILDSLLNAVRDNPGLAGGAVGALIASLMDQAGSSESASPSQPVDISELTSFNPRTTDFGAGMVGGRTGTGSPLVSYQDYAEGYGDETPDDRLYSDLGISGWLREPDMADYRDESGNLTDQSGNLVDEYGYLMDDGSEEETAVEDAYEAEEEPAMAAGGATHYTFGRVMNPAENLGIGQGMKKGGLSQAHTVHSHHTNPVIDNRVDFRKGSAVNGAGDGQSDDIPAWLADGEYVMDAELVSMLGNGSNKAGAKILDKFREDVRAHKRSAPLGKIPPKAKSPLNYLKESMNG